ncbi:protein yellow-like [Sitophilus oryzae]|uniref:Protein yellow-like n=1 Tax=Sitophilus oryzae TaxID=7048 RepID=A0A6J2YTE9_SITOR|nr:protein yellow-like [Sitophilus oryzae]
MLCVLRVVFYFNVLFCYCCHGYFNENYGFGIEYQWVYLNYTWPSPAHYQWAISTKTYIPQNNAPVGIKIYRNLLFVSIPRFREGIPATLTVLDRLTASRTNPLLTPYPSWSANGISNCHGLQSIQSMEVDTRGIMWIIDGVRINNLTTCPPKLVLLDLNNDGRLVHSYVFKPEISLGQGGFLNDLVVEDVDGGYAYITDNSGIDPGIIVYSRRKNRAWKLRDGSMFAERRASNFAVADVAFNNSVPVDGIALSPKTINGERILYYCALTSFTLYSILTNVIRDEDNLNSGSWRNFVTPVGTLTSQVDGIAIDSQANMYFTLLPLYGVGRWNLNDPLESTQMIHQDPRTTIWPDGFAFDQEGVLYVISNQVFRYIDPRSTPPINSNVKFRILGTFIGTRSYLYG